MTTIHLHDDELATIWAALEFYRDSGMGEPDQRPDWLHEIACPAPGDTTSLDAAGIHELSILIQPVVVRGGSGGCTAEARASRQWLSRFAALSDMTKEALRLDKPFFVVAMRRAHYYDSIQDAYNCACEMNGIVYTATAKGCRKTIDLNDHNH